MNATSERLLATVVPELQRRFRIAVQGCAARGVDVLIHSGFRTRAQQQRLYNNRANNRNPVAAPGTSPHEFGVAIDATPIPRTSAAWSVLWSEAKKAGLVLGVNFRRRDPPHFELPGFVHGRAEQPTVTRPEAQPVPAPETVQPNNYGDTDDSDPYAGLKSGSSIPTPLLIGGAVFFFLWILDF